MKVAKYLTAPIIFSLLSGCTQPMVVSKRAESDSIKKGIIYSLPKQLVKVTYKRETEYLAEDVLEELTITPEDPIPDIDLTFYAEMKHRKMSSDTLEISTKNGLLDSVIGHSEDKTGEIVVSLAGSFSGFLSGFSLVPSFRFELFRQPSLQPKRQDFEPCVAKEEAILIEQVVDPGKEGDIESLNNRLRAGCINLTVDANDKSRVERQIKALEKLPENSTTTDINGLIYRQPGSLAFIIKRIKKSGSECNEDDDCTVIESISPILAQGGQIGILPLPNGIFSNNKHELSFSNGMLLKSKTIQPSEVLNTVSIIPNTLKAMISVPAELLQLKVNYSTQEKKLLEFKKAMLDEQAQIIKKQAELEKIKNTEKEKTTDTPAP